MAYLFAYALINKQQTILLLAEDPDSYGSHARSIIKFLLHKPAKTLCETAEAVAEWNEDDPERFVSRFIFFASQKNECIMVT